MARILIAEDDMTTRRLLKGTLQRFGHEVIDVADGKTAWEKLHEADAPQLAILDWMMPGMDGPDIVRQLREEEREKYCYMLLLTSKSEKEDVVEGWKAGADDFVTKPFDRSELQLRLRAGERIIALENNLAKKNFELADANVKITTANLRMRDELQAAAKAQEALLPSEDFENEHVSFSWKFEPCEELAGDIMNYFKLDENHIGLYVLDVSGHGVSSALLSVTVNRILTPQQRQSSLLATYDDTTKKYNIHPPLQVLRELNKRFPLDLRTGQYFTIIYGVINLQRMEFTYISAGHPRLVFASATNGTTAIEAPGLPVGFDEDAHYEEITLQLCQGDRLYLYSDGINEAKNSTREEFGVERLIELVDESRELELGKSNDRLVQRVKAWTTNERLEDDITILSLEVLKKQECA